MILAQELASKIERLFRHLITVASYMPGSELDQVRRMPDAKVAVWLGPQFDGVASGADADPGLVSLPTAAPICRTANP
jgi:hypothetical protein